MDSKSRTASLNPDIEPVIVARFTLSPQGWTRDRDKCLYLNEVDYPSIFLAGSNIRRDFKEIDEATEGIVVYTPKLDVPNRFEFDCWWTTLKRVDEEETNFCAEGRYIELCLSTDSRCWYYLDWVHAGRPEVEK